MHASTRPFVLAIGSALLLAAAVGTASATRLSISEQAIRTQFRELSFRGFGGLFTIVCPLTLEGSFHSRTISKISGQLIGYITRAALTQASCTGATAAILNGIERAEGVTTRNTLPWHIQYNSFTGTLPRISGVRIGLIGWSWLFRVSILGTTVSCLYRSTQASPAFGIVELNPETGAATGLRADEGSEIPFNSGAGSCPSTGRFSGRGTATTQAGGTLTVRLVR